MRKVTLINKLMLCANKSHMSNKHAAAVIHRGRIIAISCNGNGHAEKLALKRCILRG